MEKSRTRWLTVEEAAESLSTTPVGLRRMIDRRLERSPSGAPIADIDGIRARKFGRRWRILLTGDWALPS